MGFSNGPFTREKSSTGECSVKPNDIQYDIITKRKFLLTGFRKIPGCHRLPLYLIENTRVKKGDTFRLAGIMTLLFVSLFLVMNQGN
jgi:hypothetical protein